MLVPPASTARNNSDCSVRFRCSARMRTFQFDLIGCVEEAEPSVRANFSVFRIRVIVILTLRAPLGRQEQNPAVQDRIRSLLSEMPSAVARVAAYLLEHPQAPLTLSIGELAEKAGASPATVTRFCRTIGYPGYVELRVGIATDVGRSASLDSWTAEIGGEFGPADSPEDLLRMLISSHTKALREATSAIDLAVITEVSRRIALSSHIDIYGVVGSAMLADELQGRLYRIGVRRTPGRRSAASRARPSRTPTRWRSAFRPRTNRRDDRDAGRGAPRGAFTVAIHHQRPIFAELADRSIVTSIYEQFRQPDDLSAKHGQLLVLDLLYLLVAQENFDRSSAKLAASAHAVSSTVAHVAHRQGAGLDPIRPGAGATEAREEPA